MIQKVKSFLEIYKYHFHIHIFVQTQVYVLNQVNNPTLSGTACLKSILKFGYRNKFSQFLFNNLFNQFRKCRGES